MAEDPTHVTTARQRIQCATNVVKEDTSVPTTILMVTAEMFSEESYLDCLISDLSTAWRATVNVSTYPTIFKLDTGTEVTVVRI